MKAITLSNGLVAYVSDEDSEAVGLHQWHAIPRNVKHSSNRYYAATSINGERVYLHQFLMPDAKEVDHKNNNGLDNQRTNLRACTHQQNGANIDYPLGASGYRGVYRDKRKKQATRPFSAKIAPRGKRIHIGCFATAEEAARAYDVAARTHFGEFARTNFPDTR